jgi:type II secretion system protein G
MSKVKSPTQGFTIVELLIVIVVIGILAAITVVAYNGIQQRGRDARRLADIKSVDRALQLYYVDNGSYPSTSTLDDALTDSTCAIGSKSTNWVPGLVPTYLPRLPQSFSPRTADPLTGCYQYASDGARYVISVWQAVESGAQTSTLYRRLGFREGWAAQAAGKQSYYCANGAAPAYWDAYYKYSYTISNITTCNET